MAEKLGVGSADLKKAKVIELTSPSSAARNAGAGKSAAGKLRQFTQYIEEDGACSACYAALVFALSRLDPAEIKNLGGKIAIGQSFQGKQGSYGKPDSDKNGGGQSLGIGRCTSGFAAFCPGCPPSGKEVLAFLRKNSGYKC
jgi:hypothetical protein